MAKPTIQVKLLISLLTAVLFIIFSMPILYAFMNGLTKNIGLRLINSAGCPSMTGILVHAVVFALVIFLIMLI